VLGGSALFAMALGMGVPLMAVGVSEGALLPRAGAWMVLVKKFFGLMMLAVALWIISPVLPPLAGMLGWSLLAFGAASLLRRWWAAAAVPLVLGIALLVGALAGSRDPLRPLAVFTAGTPHSAPVAWTRVASLAELQAQLKAPGKTVMLDFYADWCVSCKEMEAFTFSDPKVRAQMDRMLLLQVDVTANSAEHKALLKRFSLFGPPGIIFFDPQGREIRGLRVIGYQNAERFLKTLSLATAP
jgi:thiol:disulfide interchange protein DsbD